MSVIMLWRTMSVTMLWRPCVVVLLCFWTLVAPSFSAQSETCQQRMSLEWIRPGTLRQPAIATVTELSPLGLRLRGGYRSEGAGKGGSGGKERHRRRSRDKKASASSSDREKSADKTAGSAEGLAFQGGPPVTLETLLDNPAVQDFAANLFSNPGFQAVANSMLSDQKNLDMLKSYAGVNSTYSAEEREELVNFLGLDSNTTAEQTNSSSNSSEAANVSSVASPEGEGETGMGSMLDAMGEITKGAMASQWSHDKEHQMRTDPGLAALQDSPKMREMQAEIAANGPMAVLKYVDDPEAMEVIQKIIGITMQ